MGGDNKELQAKIAEMKRKAEAKRKAAAKAASQANKDVPESVKTVPNAGPRPTAGKNPTGARTPAAADLPKPPIPVGIPNLAAAIKGAPKLRQTSAQKAVAPQKTDAELERERIAAKISGGAAAQVQAQKEAKRNAESNKAKAPASVQTAQAGSGADTKPAQAGAAKPPQADTAQPAPPAKAQGPNNPSGQPAAQTQAAAAVAAAKTTAATAPQTAKAEAAAPPNAAAGKADTVPAAPGSIKSSKPSAIPAAVPAPQPIAEPIREFELTDHMIENLRNSNDKIKGMIYNKDGTYKSKINKLDNFETTYHDLEITLKELQSKKGRTLKKYFKTLELAKTIARGNDNHKGMKKVCSNLAKIMEDNLVKELGAANIIFKIPEGSNIFNNEIFGPILQIKSSQKVRTMHKQGGFKESEKPYEGFGKAISDLQSYLQNLRLMPENAEKGLVTLDLKEYADKIQLAKDIITKLYSSNLLGFGYRSSINHLQKLVTHMNKNLCRNIASQSPPTFGLIAAPLYQAAAKPNAAKPANAPANAAATAQPAKPAATTEKPAGANAGKADTVPIVEPIPTPLASSQMAAISQIKPVPTPAAAKAVTRPKVPANATVSVEASPAQIESIKALQEKLTEEFDYVQFTLNLRFKDKDKVKVIPTEKIKQIEDILAKIKTTTDVSTVKQYCSELQNLSKEIDINAGEQMGQRPLKNFPKLISAWKIPFDKANKRKSVTFAEEHTIIPEKTSVAAPSTPTSQSWQTAVGTSEIPHHPLSLGEVPGEYGPQPNPEPKVAAKAQEPPPSIEQAKKILKSLRGSNEFSSKVTQAQIDKLIRGYNASTSNSAGLSTEKLEKYLADLHSYNALSAENKDRIKKLSRMKTEDLATVYETGFPKPNLPKPKDAVSITSSKPKITPDAIRQARIMARRSLIYSGHTHIELPKLMLGYMIKNSGLEDRNLDTKQIAARDAFNKLSSSNQKSIEILASPKAARVAAIESITSKQQKGATIRPKEIDANAASVAVAKPADSQPSNSSMGVIRRVEAPEVFQSMLVNPYPKQSTYELHRTPDTSRESFTKHETTKVNVMQSKVDPNIEARFKSIENLQQEFNRNPSEALRKQIFEQWNSLHKDTGQVYKKEDDPNKGQPNELDVAANPIVKAVTGKRYREVKYFINKQRQSELLRAPEFINQRVNQQLSALLKNLGAISPELRTKAEAVIKNKGYVQTHAEVVTNLLNFIDNNKKELGDNYQAINDSLTRLRDIVPSPIFPASDNLDKVAKAHKMIDRAAWKDLVSNMERYIPDPDNQVEKIENVASRVQFSEMLKKFENIIKDVEKSPQEIQLAFDNLKKEFEKTIAAESEAPGGSPGVKAQNEAIKQQLINMAAKFNATFPKKIETKWTNDQNNEATTRMRELGLTGNVRDLMIAIKESKPEVTKSWNDLQKSASNDNNPDLKNDIDSFRAALIKVMNDPTEEIVDVKQNCQEMLKTIDNYLIPVHTMDPTLTFSNIQTPTPKVETSPLFLVDADEYFNKHKNAGMDAISKISSDKFTIQRTSGSTFEIRGIPDGNAEGLIEGAKAVQAFVRHEDKNIKMPIMLRGPDTEAPNIQGASFKTFQNAKNAGLDVNVIIVGNRDVTDVFKNPPTLTKIATAYANWRAKPAAPAPATPAEPGIESLKEPHPDQPAPTDKGTGKRKM